MNESRNNAVLQDFMKYCQEHPEQRFWQALCNWSGFHKIRAVRYLPATKPSEKDSCSDFDTFHWEGKNEKG